jgi:hypothetical protein
VLLLIILFFCINIIFYKLNIQLRSSTDILDMPVEERSWMYEGWNDNDCHSEDWVRNTNVFLDHAFGSVPNAENLMYLAPA